MNFRGKGNRNVLNFAQNKAVKKILVIRFSSIGDIVLTTPVVRCLKEQLPGCQVHYLTKEVFLPVIEANPYIDKIFTIRKSISEVVPALRMENYDHLIDLHKNLRSWSILIKLFKPFSTFSKLNIRKFLICKLKIDLLPDIHIVDRYFQSVSGFHITNDGKGLDYFIPEGVDPYAKIPGLPRQGYVCLVIGGKHATKQLPKEKLLTLCEKIHKPLVLLGGPEDRATAEFLVNQLPLRSGTIDNPTPGQSKHIYNTTGLLTLHESALLLKACDQVITHDTGLMHIAAAFSKDIISVWGNTIPSFGMYPYYPEGTSARSKILEVKDLSCRPCSKLGYEKCPKGHFRCMMEIPTGEILNFVQ